MKYNKFYNGITKTRVDQNGLYTLDHCNVHEEIGFCEAQYDLEEDTDANAPDEKTNLVVTESGTIYAFSRDSGKIWKYVSGSWATVTANANTTGHRGAAYFNGYVYYSTASKLGRFVQDTEASRSDTYHTFSNSSNNKPMAELNLQLFIGNAKDLASVSSAGVVSDAALDLPLTYQVNALIGVGADLLIGTYSQTTVNETKAFLWDTYSDSWLIEDAVPEKGINAFIKGDNITFASCGDSGMLYYWDGNRLRKYKRIRGASTTVTQRYNVAVLNGKALFGAINKVYAIHREDNDLPFALNLEYTTSSATIRSMASIGDELFVAHDNGVDIISSDRATATVETPEVEGPFNYVTVMYDSLPAGTSIDIYTKKDGGSWTQQTAITDTINKTVYFDGGLGEANFIQARAVLNPSSGDTPVIRSIELN